MGVPEPEFEIWDSCKAPDGTAFGGELGGNPELENLRLALELAAILAVVNSREARDIDLATIIVLTDALGEEVADLRDLEKLVSRLEFGPLFVS